ncbi:MAG TPA: recombinase RecT [Dongiaceae bacterium]|nr:recombinase RecT [Dongiaceae bacterium]
MAQANQATGLPALLEQHRDQLKQILPKYIDLDTFIRNAKTLASDSRLRECTPQSLYKCCVEAAERGWEIASPRKHCAVVSMQTKSGTYGVLIPQWQGRVFSWNRAGAVRKVIANVVYVDDEFSIEMGDNERIIHRPNLNADHPPAWLNDIKNIVGSYAVALLWNGEHIRRWVPRVQLQRTIEFVKKKNKGELGFGWQDWLPEMCCKTAIHRLEGLIQGPPDMNEEQLDAWKRASLAAEPDYVEVESEAHRNVLLSEMGDDAKPEETKPAEPAKTAAPAVSSAAESTPKVDPNAIISEDEQDDLLQAAAVAGMTPKDLREYVKATFKKKIAEMTKQEAYDTGKHIDGLFAKGK